MFHFGRKVKHKNKIRQYAVRLNNYTSENPKRQFRNFNKSDSEIKQPRFNFLPSTT